VNIVKSLIENDKIKPYIKEFAEKGYERIINFGVTTPVQKSIREEEEKKWTEHEKKTSGDKDKMEFYTNRRIPTNGFKSYGKEYNKRRSYTPIGSKSSVPKTSSNAKLKKPIKKKKVVKVIKDQAGGKVKTKTKKK